MGRDAPPARGGLGGPSVVYTISSDGVLHVISLQSGKDVQKPAPFLPANAKWSDAIAVNTTLYAATVQGCGGAPNGVWAIDLESAAKDGCMNARNDSPGADRVSEDVEWWPYAIDDTNFTPAPGIGPNAKRIYLPFAHQP